jgi:integrase
VRKDGNGDTFISFTQKKTKQWENLPVSREAMKFLPERGEAADSDPVYVIRSGGYENSILKTWAIAAGIDKRVSYHTSRHTHATLLLSLEVPIETVSNYAKYSVSHIYLLAEFFECEVSDIYPPVGRIKP